MLPSKIDMTIDRYGDCMRQTDACFRTLRDGEMDKVRVLYKELKSAQEAQAWGYFAVILGSFCKIVSAGFPQDDGVH